MKNYLLGALVLIFTPAAQAVNPSSSTAKVFFVNATNEKFDVKGPFGKNDRYVSSVPLDVDDVNLVELNNPGSELFKVRFLTGDRYARNRVAKEFDLKINQPYTTVLLTKLVDKDKDGNDVVTYGAEVSTGFSAPKLIEPKDF